MSIKKKFVTAITTAGLLAGLFGSAFVPSAFAVRTIDTDESYAFVGGAGRNANLDDTAGDGEIGVSSNFADGDLDACRDTGDNEYDFSADCELASRLQISSYVDYGIKPNGPDDAANGPTGYTYGDDFSIGFLLIDDEGDEITEADLSATVTGGKIKVAFAYLENDTERVRCSNPNLRSEFKTTGDAVSDAQAAADTDNNDKLDGDNAGEYFLCIRAVSTTTLGTSNLVIKADGVTIWSGSVQVIGDLDELDLSIQGGYNHVAAGNEFFGQYAKVVGKDSAGQAIWGTADGFANYESDVLFGNDSLSYYARGTNAVNMWDSIQVGKYGGGLELDEDVCLTADVGDTKTAAVDYTNYQGDRIVSNTVSILCTEAQDEFVVTAAGITQEYANPILTGEANWDASAQGEDDASGEIEIYAVVKDSEGNLMGVDDSTGFDTDLTYTITGAAGLNIDESIVGLDGDASDVGVGGKVILGNYDPNLDAAAKFEIEIEFADGDGATSGSQAVAKSLYYLVRALDLDYTLTRVRNASKTSATWTADWGLECSNAVVYFDWVNKNGTKGTLATGTSPIARRANFDGVATFTLKKRNMTIYVTAYACDDFSEDTDELGPVKARFR